MKRILLAVLVIISLLAVLVAQTTVIQASDHNCQSGAVGTVFSFSFSGFTPNKYVYAYLVEPDGAARGYDAIKVSSSGVASTSIGTHFASATIGVGKWRIVVEEHANGNVVVKQGIGCFIVTGGTEGVSGASLSANPSEFSKPIKGQTHAAFDVPDGSVTFNFWASTSTTVSGSGFLPGEVVSFWVEQPGGECSSFSVHRDQTYRFTVNGVGFIQLDDQYNSSFYNGLGTFAVGNAQASSGGTVSVNVFFFVFDCEGEWKIVARGNTSGRGAMTSITLVGNPIEETAELTASSESVGPMNDYVSFYGKGFAAKEHISCWITTPQGQVTGYPDDSGLNFNFAVPGISETLKDNGYFADGGGNIGFGLVTGSFYDKFNYRLVLGGDTVASASGVRRPAEMSQGALGVWAMTCRGDTSGRIGIARFCLGDCVVPPTAPEGQGANPGGAGGATPPPLPPLPPPPPYPPPLDITIPMEP